MNFKEDCTYHIYNRSNELLFYNRDNYLFFLRKIRNHILPYSDILAYCLMPNHFHIILKVNKEGTAFSEKKKTGRHATVVTSFRYCHEFIYPSSE